MLRGIDVAKYILSLDPHHQLFNKNLCKKNGRTFYEGNARLNKYMHLAQNIYIAKYGKPLMDSVFYAYDNGAVDTKIQENYSVLLNSSDKSPNIDASDAEYLKKIFKIFSGATLDELIELSHEDSEWAEKHNYYKKEDQIMDSMSRKEEYANQYADIIKILERMVA